MERQATCATSSTEPSLAQLPRSRDTNPERESVGPVRPVDPIRQSPHYPNRPAIESGPLRG
jgi:hypothetical protein